MYHRNELEIKTKFPYFTIEQIFCADFMFVHSYSTFKIIDSHTILLHKYGETYTDRRNPDNDIPDKIWTANDFGTIHFEEVTMDFLIKLRGKSKI